MTAYQYWSHKRSGETWAVQIIDGQVVGACGPLYHSDRPRDMRDFEYDRDEGEKINKHAGDYRLSS